MKIMDNSVQDDCKIEAVVPMKKKKLKQARLPFQMLSSTDLPINGVNKKRKLSPPIESKSSKILKTTVKENDIKDDDSDELCTDVNTETVTHEEDVKTTDEKKVKPQIKDKSPSKKHIKRSKTTPRKTPLTKTRKLESKGDEKSSVLKFLKTPDKYDDSDHDSNKCETDIIDSETISKKEENDELNSTNISIGNDSMCVKSDSEMNDLSSDNERNDITKQSDDSMEIDVKNQTPKTPISRKSIENMKDQMLTPKQLEKKMQIEQKREEKQKLKLEKEKKKEEERENRQKLKEEIRRRKEEKEKAEKEQKKKEKELKEFKKQMEIEQKQKEKEAKEEERRKKEEAKEEEKRKKEEEKLEAERRKQKAALNFASFFLAKKQESKTCDEENVAEIKNFMPFEIKADMRIAPICRRTLSEHEKVDLDKKFSLGSAKKSNLYLQEMKSEGYVLHKSEKTWPLEGKDDVILMDQAGITVEKHRPKLLQFTENQRPPYWGTWRKRSNTVTARKPFYKDSKWFDYEIDSDEEWEEEEPGESLRGSDDEKDEGNPEDNEYDVDNEFMVPHGYLSDEEARADEEEREDMSPETQKYKLKILGEQFEAERNAKTSKLKPRIIGCVWQGADNSFPENVPPKVVEFLSARQAWVRQIPITLPSTLEPENAVTNKCGTPTQQPGTSRKTKVPKEALADLIRLIHGNTHGRKFLVKEFMTFWNKKNRSDEKQLSKVSLLHKIREIAKWTNCPEEGPMYLKTCWYVSEDVREEHLPADKELSLPNRWTYMLTPKRKSDILEDSDKPDREEKEKEKEKEREKEKRNVPLITQFTKKITQEEMKKQLITKPVEIAPSKPPQQKSSKRATLISVGRGEQFPKASPDSLFTKFISNEKAKDAEFRESNKSNASDGAAITNKNNETNDNKKSDKDTHSDILKTEPLEEIREQRVPDVRMTDINDSHSIKKKKIRQDAKKRKRKIKEKKDAIFLSSNSFKKSPTNKERQADVCVIDIVDIQDN